MWKIIKDERGESYIDAVIIVLVSLLVIALGLKVFPVFIVKNELDTFARELARTAEIEGIVGSVTTSRTKELKNEIGIDPTVSWSRTGRIPLNASFTVTVTEVVDIGFFKFGSFPITLTSRATGRSEVYWK